MMTSVYNIAVAVQSFKLMILCIFINNLSNILFAHREQENRGFILAGKDLR